MESTCFSHQVRPETRIFRNVVFILNVGDNGTSRCKCLWYYLCTSIVRILYLTFQVFNFTLDQLGSSVHFLRQGTILVSNLVIFQDLLIAKFEHPLESLSSLQSFYVKGHIFDVFIITEFLLGSLNIVDIYLKDLKMLFFYYSCRIVT